jgi:phosphatidylserine/phosphatidylglycerophosphate/cardiolipin synthase-like enzyme
VNLKLLFSAFIFSLILETHGSTEIPFVTLADRWRIESAGHVRPRLNLNSQTIFKLKKFRQTTYWDIEGASLSESVMQKVFELDWNQTSFQQEKMTFLEFKEKEYESYLFREKDFRYTLPFAGLKGWWGLNHPPVEKLESPLSAYHPEFRKKFDLNQDHAFYDPRFQLNLDKLTGTELTFGNRLDLLKNGDSFREKLELISRTKKRLWVTSLVFFCDESSSQLIDAMAKKSKMGVDVKLIVESYSSRILLTGCIRRMREKGIDVLVISESLNPETFRKVSHSKFWIRDGEEAIMGGQNIMDSENLSTGLDDKARDTDVHIKSGPAVTDLDLKYAEIWEMRRKKMNRKIPVSTLSELKLRYQKEVLNHQRGSNFYSEVLRDPLKRNQGVCRVISQGPGKSRATIVPAISSFVRSSSDFIYLTSPKIKYESGEPAESYEAGPIFEALIERGSNGVRIDLITNGVDAFAGDLTRLSRKLAERSRDNDHLFGERLGWGVSDLLAQAFTKKKVLRSARDLRGSSEWFHVWNYFRFSHQKVHLFDRRVIGIGSFNLDAHSTEGNRETEIFCMDEHLLQQSEVMAVQDLVNSVPVRRD